MLLMRCMIILFAFFFVFVFFCLKPSCVSWIKFFCVRIFLWDYEFWGAFFQHADYLLTMKLSKNCIGQRSLVKLGLTRGAKADLNFSACFVIQQFQPSSHFSARSSNLVPLICLSHTAPWWTMTRRSGLFQMLKMIPVLHIMVTVRAIISGRLNHKAVRYHCSWCMLIIQLFKLPS